MAAHEFYILRMPCQIFAIEAGIVDDNILALPERVLCEDVGMVDFHMPAILEYIFRIAFEAININVA